MKHSSFKTQIKQLLKALPILIAVVSSMKTEAQNCPANIPVSISSNPNTYFPGLDNNLSSGALTVSLGAAGYGSIPIASGDLLLIIQMQGSQINSNNTLEYGDGISGGSVNGYLSNTEMLAGNMEYIVATSNVPLEGGTLTLLQATTRTYRSTPFGTDGQYRFQVIRVGLFHMLTLTGSLSAPKWDGSTGGVIAISVTSDFNLNGFTISAAGAGFRGGAGRQLGGGSGGSNADQANMSTAGFHGSKGEGIAGTPRFINNNGTLLDNGASNEGYPGGSYASGAPGNAGGGGTDGNTSNNEQNSGGGGGSNGGAGGRGGNSWSSNLSIGGYSGKQFDEKSPSRLVMGGGGGAGTSNNGTGNPGAGFASSGSAGGGIVLITAGNISGIGTIDVSGANAFTTVGNDASGGAGAGGSVLIFAGSGHAGITVNAAGGIGGTNGGGGSPPPHGPGGGGGGGVVYSNAMMNPSTNVNGGIQGRTTGDIEYGSLAGNNGVLVQNISNSQVPPQFLHCSVLPVKFKTVAAKLQDKFTSVSWQVTNEEDVHHYNVEKSTDNKNFTLTGVVNSKPAANGNNSYNFTDTKNTASGIVYYRIQSVSAGNKTIYSAVVMMQIKETLTRLDLAVTPNPAVSGIANVRFYADKTGTNPVQLRMVSASGITVWQKQYKPTEGLNIVSISNISSIPNGMYFLQFYNEQTSVNVKMIVRH